jgi:hypothetical protein
MLYDKSTGVISGNDLDAVLQLCTPQNAQSPHLLLFLKANRLTNIVVRFGAGKSYNKDVSHETVAEPQSLPHTKKEHSA